MRGPCRLKKATTPHATGAAPSSTARRITVRNKELVRQGKKAGCREYAELHNSGYRGLYNGLDEDAIHRLKRLTRNQKILDHMSAAETAANAFRVTQAKLRIERDNPTTLRESFKIAQMPACAPVRPCAKSAV